MEAKPGRIFGAIICLLFGVMLVWWTGPRVAVFAGLFSDNWAKSLFWLSYTSMIINLTLVIPFAIIFGYNIEFFNIIKSFSVNFFAMVATTALLFAVPPILSAISNLFDLEFIMTIGWIVLFIVIAYLLFWLPIKIALDLDNPSLGITNN